MFVYFQDYLILQYFLISLLKFYYKTAIVLYLFIFIEQYHINLNKKALQNSLKWCLQGFYCLYDNMADKRIKTAIMIQ